MSIKHVYKVLIAEASSAGANCNSINQGNINIRVYTFYDDVAILKTHQTCTYMLTDITVITYHKQ